MFSYENLDNAKAAYQKLIARIATLKESESETVDEAAFAALKEKFVQALGNDLNTSLAITAVYDVLKYPVNDCTKLAVLSDFDQVLGLDLCEKAKALRQEQAKAVHSGGDYTIISESGEKNSEVESLILARYEAKKAKNFQTADQIRDQLKAQGVEVTDIAGGAKWKRI